MTEGTIRREPQRVVQQVLRLGESYETIGKPEFEVILGKVMECVHKNTGLSLQVIGQKTAMVLRDLPTDYGQ